MSFLIRSVRSGNALRCIVLLACATLLSLLAGCGGRQTPVESAPTPVAATPSLISLSVTPATISLTVGQAQQLMATGKYSDGSTKDLTDTVSWVSGNPGVATISSSGLLTVIAPGTATIAASYQGTSSSQSSPATVTALAPAVMLRSLTVTPASARIVAGQSQQFSVAALYSDGGTQLPSDLKWAVSNTSLATITRTGLVTSTQPGNTQITASSGSVTGSAQLTIDPRTVTGLTLNPLHAHAAPGTTVQITATAVYNDGSSVDVSSKASWSTADSGVATIDSMGLLTAAKAGTTSMIAAFGGQTASGDVTVGLVPRFLFVANLAGRDISRLTVDPSTGRLRFEGYQQTGFYDEAFSCFTTDPAQKFVYSSSLIAQLPNAAGYGRVQVYVPDATTGTLTASGAPMQLNVGASCIQFEPTGHFGYATISYNATMNGIAIFTRDPATGQLALENTVTLPSEPGGLTIDPHGQYLYATALAVPEGTQAFAYGYSIDPKTGALTPIQGTPFAINYAATTIQFAPSGQYVYLLNGGAYSISQYSINRTTGQLTSIPSNTTVTGVNPTGLTFSLDGRFAYGSISEERPGGPFQSKVVSFSVAASGLLTKIGEAPTENATPTLLLDPSGRYMYAANGVTDYIDCYQIGADGVAMEIERLESQVSPETMVILGGNAPVSYATTDAYVATTTDNKFTQYSVGADGSLVQKQSFRSLLSPFSMAGLPWGNDLLLAGKTAQPNVQPFVLREGGLAYNNLLFGDAQAPGGVAIDPSGIYAFESDAAQGVIYTYRKFNGFWDLLHYLPTGAPEITSFAAGAGAAAMVTDADGRFLFVANQVANSLSVFEYDGGAPELREVTAALTGSYGDGSPYALPSSPVAIAMGAENRFLYILTKDGTLRVYAEDGGHLALTATTKTTGGGGSIAEVPDSNLLYVATSGGVEGFSVDPTSGALTAADSGISLNLAGVTGIYVEPSGRYLYATTGAATGGSGAGAIHGYAIGDGGALSPLASSPVTTSGQPAAMSFSTAIQ